MEMVFLNRKTRRAPHHRLADNHICCNQPNNNPRARIPKAQRITLFAQCRRHLRRQQRQRWSAELRQQDWRPFFCESRPDLLEHFVSREVKQPTNVLIRASIVLAITAPYQCPRTEVQNLRTILLIGFHPRIPAGLGSNMSGKARITTPSETRPSRGPLECRCSE